MKRFPYIWQAVTCILLIILDQVPKYFARIYLKGNPIELLEGIFSLHYLENRGAVWGMFQGKVDFFLVAFLILVAFMIYVYVRMPKTTFYLPLFWIITFMMAGAIGNTIDRFFFGFVTDFLYFELIDFPIFNIADCYLTVCSFLTIILVFTKYKDEPFSFLMPRRKDAVHDTDKTDTDEN